MSHTKIGLKNGLTPEIEKQLGEFASLAKTYSYSPYSKFRVGAALLAESGNVFLGCNVENASYGGAICAERTAVVKAVSSGEKKYLAIAITSDQNDFISPCGFCRQFMVEFGKKLIVLLVTAEGKVKKFTLEELLPLSFGPDNLENRNDL
ncbi:hypothetical protein HK103_001457 [Boothiomyces macroporosus]|uniref:Cytidine deaminase n=1 Tax=Boothiomyces macroporosus TaxID=261099 RepID=A0AAD5UNW0_9FUNG|nr:hypothetical protein HK103_001457 [Boothiomyces macroporosus]